MTDLDAYRDLYDQARQAQVSGQYGEAISHYDSLFETLVGLRTDIREEKPQFEELLHNTADNLVELLRWEDRYQEAIDIQRELLSLFPDEELIRRTEIAVIKLERGDVEEGLSELKGVANEEPDNIWGWITLGAQCLRVEQYEEARKALERAVSLEDNAKKDLGFAYGYLFTAYRALGKLEEAESIWKEAHSYAPGALMALPDVYEMFIEGGNYAKARSYLRQESNRILNLFYLAEIERQQGNDAMARRLWERVVNLDPDEYRGGRVEWADASLRTGRVQPALKVLSDSVTRGGATPRHLMFLGLAWAKQGDVEKAASALDGAQALISLSRPLSGGKLPDGMWTRFEEAVQDEETLSALEGYFGSADAEVD